jgi:hypothetical protein
MRKLYIITALVIVFLATWLIDWNIRQGSYHLAEDQSSTMISRDDDILELEIGLPGGKTPPPDPQSPERTRRLTGQPTDSAGGESGEKTVIRLRDPSSEEEPRAGADSSTSASSPGADWFLYEVKKGDTLSEIAQTQLGTAQRTREIMELNNIEDPRRIQVGMKLKIPSR